MKTNKPWITRKNKLGGRGFLSKPLSVKHKLIDNCVGNYGYKSCLGSLLVLNRNRLIKAKHSKHINNLVEYTKHKYSLKKHSLKGRKKYSKRRHVI